ncbi:hypothetical protein WJX84_011119 [Apatococcus fuscideae]|uniref:Uncharacterized protein n=1 Tax=Apatococcus fuscideae TaxID=2026836 RepID=A0AAW1TBR4_9CHLO
MELASEDLLGPPALGSRRYSRHLAACNSATLCAVGADCTIRRLSLKGQLQAEGKQADRAANSDTAGPDLQPTVPPCIPQHFRVSRNGDCALLGGPTLDDSDRSALCLVELPTGSQPSAAQMEPLLIDAALYDSHPGLEIFQIDWHPSSPAHFAVLTSDATWRLYCLDDLSSPEQQIILRFRPSRKVGLTQDIGSQSVACVAFCFGVDHAWERFTVFFTCADGAVYCMCPVAPFRSTCPASSLPLLHSLAASASPADAGPTKEWLHQALPQTEASTRSRMLVQPHVLELHAPALIGPPGYLQPGP